MAKREIEILVGGCAVSKELLKQGLTNDHNMLGASALVDAKNHDLVLKVQEMFMDAGATLITTSNYDVVPGVGFTGEEIREYTRHAARLAVEARKHAGKEATVKICGSLPPLMPSFRSDRTVERTEGHDMYLLIGEALWPFVDMYVLETMSSVKEAKMAYEAVHHLKKPVMVSFALAPGGGQLRSGEPVLDAIEKLLDFSDQLSSNNSVDNVLAAVLFNCSQPEDIGKTLKLINESEVALEMLRGHGVALGGYGNRISPSSKAGRQEEEVVGGGMPLDLDMEIYGQFAVRWIDFGASLVGGCCGISPKYIAKVAAEVVGP